MHEMSLAMNIVELAVARAAAEGAVSINRIEVEVGALAGVLADSLAFCFEAAAKNTLAEGAELDILARQGRGRCKACGAGFRIDSFMDPCPACGGYQVEIIEGRELRLCSLIIDE